MTCRLKDTINLRHNAKFKTKVFENVHWVPITALGETDYTNEQFKRQILVLSGKDCLSKINTLYEAIQLLQLGDFEARDDNILIEEDGETWEYHTSGKDAFFNNGGCCASVASWLCFVLNDKYDEIGLMSTSPLTGNGHVLNYIKQDNKFYIVDPYAMVNAHASYVVSETGLKSDFVRSKIMTCGLFEVENLSDFANLYARRHYFTSPEFLFFKHKNKTCPPIYQVLIDKVLYLKIKSQSSIVVEQKNKPKYMKVKFC